jgi:hypothetical protein
VRRPLRPHEEAVLLAAGTRARRAATDAALRRALDRVRWDALLEELARQRLVPLLGPRILAAAAGTPPAFRTAVEAETRAARGAGELGELVTLRVVGALEASGVPAVPLKGPLLARALHGDAAMRSSRDIDVLVARHELGRAAAALAPLGWHADPAAAAPVLHTRLVAPGLPDVELHWRLHWYEREFAAAALRRAVPSVGGVRRLRPRDELAALMLFHVRDGLAGLRHAADVAAWWDRDGGASPAPLRDVLAAHPKLERALTASALVLEPLVGTPAAALLGAAPRRPWGVRCAAALADPLMRADPAQIMAEVSLVDGLVAPRGGRRTWLRRRALPAAAELPASARPRPIARRRAEHLARLAARSVVALGRPRPALR